MRDLIASHAFTLQQLEAEKAQRQDAVRNLSEMQQMLDEQVFSRLVFVRTLSGPSRGNESNI